MDVNSELHLINGVGEQITTKLNYLGLRTINDLINYYPRRYDDFSKIEKIKSIKPGQVTVAVKVKSTTGHYARKGLHITDAIVSDDSGSTRVTWFNQPYRLTSFKQDHEYFLTGKYELRYRRFAIFNPVVEAVSDFPVNTARIVPRYSVTKGISSSDIRRTLKKITSIINNIPETIPQEIINRYKLISRAQALKDIHFPLTLEDLKEAKRRLGFEELFMMILASELNKKEYQKSNAISINFDEQLARLFVQKLPFKLTDDQRKAIWQIYKDMTKQKPMNRLVEGDVGSGKTAVAAMAALMVINSGQQVAFMAPTELLARQHASTVNLMFKSIGLDDKVGLLIGAMTASQKDEIRKKIQTNKLMFIIGTHALIQEKVKAPNLALVIIDEQHRFGVKQRQALKLKANTQPHLLSLSATPIPRSLALTLFGELNISRLIEKPIDRRPIKTTLLSESQLERHIEAITKELKEGRQAFIVSPSIDSHPIYSVNEIFKWANNRFSEFKVGIIHGKLKAEEKNKIMDDFIEHRLDILVATTVIEVGIDVPNATTIIIFDADNFGLAQLHQLRGRVGRGEYPGKALLVYADNKTPSYRLRAIESSNDGFKLAELDLKIRGPGAIYGKIQHGLLDLRIAGLDDAKLINQAREAALYFVNNNISLTKYKQLAKEVSILQKVTNLN